jgi:hypothetical protein
MLLRYELVDFTPGQIKACHVLGHVVTKLLFGCSRLCGVAMFAAFKRRRQRAT